MDIPNVSLFLSFSSQGGTNRMSMRMDREGMAMEEGIRVASTLASQQCS